MSAQDRITALRLHDVRITLRTVWSFVEIETEAGRIGIGEATLSGGNARLRDALGALGRGLLGAAATPEVLDGPLPGELPEAAARSALDHALCDLRAQDRGLPLAASLGKLRRDRIPIYANINRRTTDRRPSGFAASARAAQADGHVAFKVAPFDEARPDLDGRSLRLALDAGFARTAAVREAIGADGRLMVDCHWRLPPGSAETVVRESAAQGLYWVECPLVESPDSVAPLRRLRRLANELGVRLAGCEQKIGLAGFLPFIEGGAYDVVMPDVKYVGGLAELIAVAEAARAAGVDISPHNPSGPISHLISLHLCQILPEVLMLEHQYDESPLFAALAGGRIPGVAGGDSAAPTNLPGLGAKLALEAAGDRVATTEWRAEA